MIVVLIIIWTLLEQVLVSLIHNIVTRCMSTGTKRTNNCNTTTLYTEVFLRLLISIV